MRDCEREGVVSVSEFIPIYREESAGLFEGRGGLMFESTNKIGINPYFHSWERLESLE